jgi:hypothetical protein
VKVVHYAGIPEGPVQKCSICGETLQDYRGAMSVGKWSPGWWEGAVEIDGPYRGRTDDIPTCESKEPR